MEIWVKVIPYRKELVTFCLERGISTFWVEGDAVGSLRKLGRVTVVSEEGDIVPGRDFEQVVVEKREDLEKLYDFPSGRIVYLALSRKEVIPLENLVAYGKRIFVPVRDEEDARVFSGILEKGVSGFVVEAEEVEQISRILEEVGREEVTIPLTEGRVTAIRVIGLGDRVCVDTCSLLEGASGMLVGNTSSGFLLVSAENLHSEYVSPRPFRVNAGAVHMYTLLPDGKTAYLSELESGSPVLVVDHEGRGKKVWVGRAKVERRPMLLIRVECEGREISAVLQNAETIRVVAPGGKQVSVAELKEGDFVLCHLAGGGRHFGVKVEETIEER
ncbi:MAG: 3-dehydroquinate synthase II [Deltaproteobacteria bacterium]|nr:MAG: 3-dehydroquinate synthase II [Deltaproteobacteria bacterium]